MPAAVVTGATSGIGEATAVELARRGWRVGVVGRNPAKVPATRERIEAAAPGAAVDVFLADLSVHAEVRRLAEEITGTYDRLDVLVNNAGVHATSPATTTEGFDVMLATNVHAPFLVSRHLHDLLAASAPARIVNVASEAHRNGGRVTPADVAALGDYDRAASFRVYGRTKKLLLLVTLEAARRWAADGVSVNAVCPGLVDTDLVADQKTLARLSHAFARTPFVRTPAQGAAMSVKVATDPALAGVTGRFFSSTHLMRLVPMVAATRDRELQRELWEELERVTGG